MEQFIIQGGHRLKGEIKVRGAKNFALKILPASLLSDQPSIISQVPEIEDIHRLLEIMSAMGIEVRRLSPGKYFLKPKKINLQLDPQLVPKLRASILLVGPLLARFKHVSLPHPGGCLIGQRPIDQFIKGFQALGAAVKINQNNYLFSAPKGLIGNKIIFTKISVTGTETLILAATLARGKTKIINAACEPEIEALADCLNKSGAKIKGAGTPIIEIVGVKKIRAIQAQVIPDRIEAGSFAILAAATRSNLKITNCRPEHLETPLKILQDLGVTIETGRNFIQIFSSRRIQPQDIITHEYPGFPTDLQAPLTVLLTQAQGQSTMHETIFENRFIYTDILNRMGAQIHLNNPREITVKGPVSLRAKSVESPDIRAGIALLIAALIAKGESTINNIYQIDRGYEKIEERLIKVGAKIKRINNAGK